LRTLKVSPFALRTGLVYSRKITACYIIVIYIQAMITAYFANRILSFFADPFIYFFVTITILNLFLIERSVLFLQSNLCIFDTDTFKDLKTCANLKMLPKDDPKGKLAAQKGLSRVFINPENPDDLHPSKAFRDEIARILSSGIDWIIGIIGYVITLILLIFVSSTDPLSGTYGNTSFPFNYIHLIVTIIGLLPTALGWGSVLLFVITIVYTPIGLKKHSDQFKIRKYTSYSDDKETPLMDYHQFNTTLFPLGEVLTAVTFVISVIMIFNGIDYSIRVLSGILPAEFLFLSIIAIVGAMSLLFVVPQAFLHGILSQEKQMILEEIYRIRSQANKDMLLLQMNAQSSAKEFKEDSKDSIIYYSNDVEILSIIIGNLEKASTWASTWFDIVKVIASVLLAILMLLLQYFLDSLFGTA